MFEFVRQRCVEFYESLPPPEELKYHSFIPANRYVPLYIDVEVEEAAEDEIDEEFDKAATERDLDELVQTLGINVEAQKDELFEKFKEMAGGEDMPIEMAADMARRMKLAPSQEDIEKLKAEIGDSLQYPQFREILKKWMHLKTDSEEILSSAFTLFDIKNQNVLTRDQISNILMSYGETLTAEEVGDVLRFAQLDTDVIDYGRIVDQVAPCVLPSKQLSRAMSKIRF